MARIDGDEQRLRVVLDGGGVPALLGEGVGERVQRARVQGIDAQGVAQVGDGLLGAAEPGGERAALVGGVQLLGVAEGLAKIREHAI